MVLVSQTVRHQRSIDKIMKDCTSYLDAKAMAGGGPDKVYLSKAEREERKVQSVSNVVEQRINYLNQLAEPVVKSSSTLAELSHKLKLPNAGVI